MKATIKEESVNNLNAKSHRKEKYFHTQYTGVVVKGNEIIEPVILRIYSTDAACNVCIWFNDGVHWSSGSGGARGYGYHRASAAAQDAFDKAGVTLSESIYGRGDGVIGDAVQGLLNAMYPDEITTVLKAHA
jgi:hypothetical protein